MRHCRINEKYWHYSTDVPQFHRKFFWTGTADVPWAWETMINTTHAAESKQIIMSKSESLSQNLSEGRLQSCLSATLTMMLSSPMTGICLGVDMMIVSKLLVVLNMVIGFRGLILWTERSLWYWQSDSSWWESTKREDLFQLEHFHWP